MGVERGCGSVSGLVFTLTLQVRAEGGACPGRRSSAAVASGLLAPGCRDVAPLGRGLWRGRADEVGCLGDE